MNKNDTIAVCGAGGFIGGALIAELKRQGYENLRAIDIKPMTRWYQRFPGVENLTLDLRRREACLTALQGVDVCFNLAADMGGMGFIELNKGLCMLSVMINTHLLEASQLNGTARFFYASSACAYAGYKQQETDVPGLREEDAYPADPEDGYGWEKLFSERMCQHFMQDFGGGARDVATAQPEEPAARKAGPLGIWGAPVFGGDHARAGRGGTPRTLRGAGAT